MLEKLDFLSSKYQELNEKIAVPEILPIRHSGRSL